MTSHIFFNKNVPLNVELLFELLNDDFAYYLTDNHLVIAAEEVSAFQRAVFDHSAFSAEDAIHGITFTQALNNWEWLQNIVSEYEIVDVGDLDVDALSVSQSLLWETIAEGAAASIVTSYKVADNAANILADGVDLKGADEVRLIDLEITAKEAEELLEMDNFDGHYIVRDTLSELGSVSDKVYKQADSVYLSDDSEPALGVLEGNEASILNIASNSEQYDWQDLSLFGGDKKMTLVEAEEKGGTLEGTEEDEVFVGDRDASNILDASAGGNNILWARGKGKEETMIGGEGDDAFVIIGDLNVGGKSSSKETTALLGRPLSELNGMDFNEDADGGEIVIEGGGGNNTLHLFGDMDISNFDISGVDNLRVYSDVTLTPDSLDQFETVRGDGRSIIRLDDDTETTYKIAPGMEDIGQFDIGENVTLEIADEDDLGGASVITGSGNLKDEGANLGGMAGYTLSRELKVGGDADGSDAHKLDIFSRGEVDRIENGFNVIEGQDGDEYLVGTAWDDLLIARKGNDILAGREGDDMYRITGEGKKTIIHTDGMATLDLSKITDYSAVISLEGNKGGSIGEGWAEIELGFGPDDTSGISLLEGDEEYNILLIVDTSASMGWGVPDIPGKTRMEVAIPALKELVNAYDEAGSPAFNIVEFDTSADTVSDGWVTADDARNDIDGLTASGYTNFHDGLLTGMDAFDQGKDDIFHAEGKNVTYFIADGEPNRYENTRSEYEDFTENEWKEFLEDNDMIARALGVGIPDEEAAKEMERVAYDGEAEAFYDDLVVPELEFAEFEEALLIQAEKDITVESLDNIIGTPNDDILTGNSRDNRLEGVNGNNEMHVRGGNDLIQGGDDEDKAVFRKDQNEYRIEIVKAGDAGRVVDIQNGVALVEGDVLVRDIGDPGDRKFDGEINILRDIEKGVFDGRIVDFETLDEPNIQTNAERGFIPTSLDLQPPQLPETPWSQAFVEWMAAANAVRDKTEVSWSTQPSLDYTDINDFTEKMQSSYEEENLKWLGYMEARLGGDFLAGVEGGVCIMWDMADLLKMTPQGRDETTTVWADAIVGGSLGVGAPDGSFELGFGMLPVEITDIVQDPPMDTSITFGAGGQAGFGQLGATGSVTLDTGGSFDASYSEGLQSGIDEINVNTSPASAGFSAEVKQNLLRADMNFGSLNDLVTDFLEDDIPGFRDVINYLSEGVENYDISGLHESIPIYGDVYWGYNAIVDFFSGESIDPVSTDNNTTALGGETVFGWDYLNILTASNGGNNLWGEYGNNVYQVLYSDDPDTVTDNSNGMGVLELRDNGTGDWDSLSDIYVASKEGSLSFYSLEERWVRSDYKQKFVEVDKSTGLRIEVLRIYDENGHIINHEGVDDDAGNTDIRDPDNAYNLDLQAIDKHMEEFYNSGEKHSLEDIYDAMQEDNFVLTRVDMDDDITDDMFNEIDIHGVPALPGVDDYEGTMFA